MDGRKPAKKTWRHTWRQTAQNSAVQCIALPRNPAKLLDRVTQQTPRKTAKTPPVQADGEGFEPPLRFPVKQFSRLPLTAVKPEKESLPCPACIATCIARMLHTASQDPIRARMFVNVGAHAGRHIGRRFERRDDRPRSVRRPAAVWPSTPLPPGPYCPATSGPGVG